MTRKSFSQENPFLQLTWDSTSLKLFLECPQKYHLTMHEGWTTSGQNIHFWFGGLVHSSIEVFEHSKAQGADFDDSLDAMTQFMMTEIAKPDIPVDEQGYKTGPNLVRTMIWYQLQYRNDPYQTVILANGRPAVELSFQYDLGYGPEDGFVYAGHIDRLARYRDAEKVSIIDHKSTKLSLSSRIAEGYANDLQFTGYQIGVEVTYPEPCDGVEINSLSVQKTLSNFARFKTWRPEEIRTEFLDELRGTLERAEEYAALAWAYAGEIPSMVPAAYPHNRTACTNYGGCHFASICSKAPSLRAPFLETNFSRRTDLWDPAKAR